MTATTAARRKRTQLALVEEGEPIVPETEIEAEEKSSISPDEALLLDSAALIDLWECKILPDMAFIYLALLHDRKMNIKFDLANFQFRWRGQIDPEKELSDAAIAQAAKKLEKKERLEIKKMTIQLELL